jgi:hypothetical protein
MTMKKLITITLIVLNTIPLGITDSSPQAVQVNKGQAAPFNGYLITPEKAVDLRNMSIDNDTNKKVNANLTEENGLLSERLKNSQDQDAYLSKQLVENRDASFLSKAAFFVFGAAVTGLISYGIYKSK